MLAAASSARFGLGRSLARRGALSQRSLSTATRTAATATAAPRLSSPLCVAQPSRCNQLFRSFSTTPIGRGSGSSDAALSERLAQELEYERETAGGRQTHSDSAEPDFLRDFKSTNVWRIQDTAGSDEIALEREFGNEKIKVLFSIGDIDAAESAFDEEGNEGDESSSSSDAAERDSEGSDGEETSFPVRCAISVSKPNSGALCIDAQAENGLFRIENISFYRDSKLAVELTAEADWKRRGLYIGPQFPTLDDQVQAQFEEWLEERGINEELATFVPMLAEWKEQKEYVQWLQHVRSFVDE